MAIAAAGQAPGLAPSDRRSHLMLAGLGIVLVIVALLSLGIGAVGVPMAQVVKVLRGAFGSGTEVSQGDALVILQVRLPRLLLGLGVGAALAISGALLQGLFRNPLADPGLIGVSAGAALAAVATIVLGDKVLPLMIGHVPAGALALAAFLGSLISTFGLYAIATREGRTSISTMLLAGIALQALASALIGLLAYLSDDRQLRDLTFWTLGSLSGATWDKVAGVAPFIASTLAMAPFLARGLNALALGEAEAFHLGIRVQRIKAASILLAAIAVGASVAAVGIVSFVGIIVPHVIRLIAGADHRVLLPASALLGAALLVAADTVARTLVAPGELPISILTVIIGAPFFLWLILRRDGDAWS